MTKATKVAHLKDSDSVKVKMREKLKSLMKPGAKKY